MCLLCARDPGEALANDAFRQKEESVVVGAFQSFDEIKLSSGGFDHTQLIELVVIVKGSWEAIFRVTKDWNRNSNTIHHVTAHHITIHHATTRHTTIHQITS